MKIDEISYTKTFEKLFRELPKEIREAVYQKLSLLLQNEHHPSLRVKKIKSKEGIWEISITKSYRITFEIHGTTALLRKIGTHDILEKP